MNNISDEVLITIFSLVRIQDFSHLICCKKFYDLLNSKSKQRIFQNRSHYHLNKYIQFKLPMCSWFEFYKRVHCAINKNKNFLVDYIIENKLLEIQSLILKTKDNLKEICKFAVIYGKLDILRYLKSAYGTELTKNIPHAGHVEMAVISGNMQLYEFLIEYYPNSIMSYEHILSAAIRSNYLEVLKWVLERYEIQNFQHYYNVMFHYNRIEFVLEFEKHYPEYEITYLNIFENGSFDILKWCHTSGKLVPKISEKTIDYLFSKNFIEIIDYYNKEIYPNSIQFIEEGSILAMIHYNALKSLKWLKENNLLLNLNDNIFNETIKYHRLEIFTWMIDKFHYKVSKESFNYICFNGNYIMLNYLFKLGYTFDSKSDDGKSIIDYIEDKIKFNSSVNDIINYRKVLDLLILE